MPINRTRYIARDFNNVGTPEAAALGAALGQLLGPDELASLVNHIAALNEFGGEVYIGAHRAKIADGQIVEHNDPEGQYETLGYLIGYNSRAQFAGRVDEADTPYGTVAPPEPAASADDGEQGEEDA